MVETPNPPVRKEEAPPSEIAHSRFQTLRNEIDRVFDEFMSWSPLRGSPFVRLGSRMLEPAADVVEADGVYEVALDVPGIPAEDIDIALAGGKLAVRCRMSEETEDARKGYYCRERRHQSFSRSFDLPADADVEKIAADLDKGVLRIRLPKAGGPAETPRKVPITSH